MQNTSEQERIIQWSLLHEPGDGLAREIYNLRGIAALEDFESGKAKRLWSEIVPEEYRGHIPDLIERIELRNSKDAVARLVERGIRWNFRPVFPADAPQVFSRLADLSPHDPYLLWVAGDIGAFEESSIAVVGTRWPSEIGVATSQRIVTEIGLPVVSGGALGIDSAAHRAALANSQPTLAVMAGGLDRAYPQQNWELFHEIVQSGGAMVSELAAGSAPTRWRFLQRNRLIAALSDATYVAEAGYRSGSLNTANHARLLGRPVWAAVGPRDATHARGCNAMVASGLAKPLRIGSQNWTDPSLLQRVEDARRNGSRTIQEIARDSGVSIRQVRELLR